MTLMDANAPQLDARLQFAVDMARRAGELILGYYQRDDLAVELKGDQSPVTAADRGAEQLIRKAIESEFPGDGVLGEEFGETPSQSGYRWILDPVDGTKSFVHGVPLFGTLIGLEHRAQVVLGVCRFPALGEMMYAARGSGAWWQTGDGQPRPARVSDVRSVSEALFCITTINGWDTIGRADALERLRKAARLTRGWGDCYGHMLVATGRAEIMVDPQMSAWDAAALLPIVEEAGGHFIDWEGNASIHSGNGVSVNAHLKDDVVKLLRRIER